IPVTPVVSVTPAICATQEVWVVEVVPVVAIPVAIAIAIAIAVPDLLARHPHQYARADGLFQLDIADAVARGAERQHDQHRGALYCANVHRNLRPPDPPPQRPTPPPPVERAPACSMRARRLPLTASVRGAPPPGAGRGRRSMGMRGQAFRLAAAVRELDHLQDLLAADDTPRTPRERWSTRSTLRARSVIAGDRKSVV